MKPNIWHILKSLLLITNYKETQHISIPHGIPWLQFLSLNPQSTFPAASKSSICQWVHVSSRHIIARLAFVLFSGCADLDKQGALDVIQHLNIGGHWARNSGLPLLLKRLARTSYLFLSTFPGDYEQKNTTTADLEKIPALGCTMY